MAQKTLSVEQLRTAYEAVGRYGSVTEASRALGIARNTFSHRWQLAKDWAAKEGLPTIETGGQQVVTEPCPRLPVSADECWALIDRFIERAKKVTPKFGTIAPRKGSQRIVIASDLHAPFHDPWSVAELIVREAKQTDTLIIGGDFTDSYAHSSFVKYERTTAQQEWAACDALLDQLSRAFREIVLISGNHDERLEKLLRRELTPETIFALEQIAEGPLDPLRALSRRYKNVRIDGHKVGRFDMGWFTQFGDVIVSHAESFSKVPGTVVRNVEDWFTHKDEELGLKPWRVLAQAHTHAMGWTPWKSDRSLWETGCLCEIHGYMLRAKIAGRNPQRRGYLTLQQSKDGVTDLNAIRPVWLDAERKAA